MEEFNFQKDKDINLTKQVNLIFNLWRTLPNGKKHRIDFDSKIYKRVFHYIKNLRQGLPLVSVLGGSANLRYVQSLKIMLKTFSNSDKRLISFLHRKWKTKEIIDLLIKIEKGLNVPTSLDHIFWEPIVTFENQADQYSKTGFSYFSLYALNENTNDQYNNFVSEFYSMPFSRDVNDTTKQREAILLEELITSKKASMKGLKNLLSWYFLARDEQFVRKVDTVTQFVKERTRLEENRANLSKTRSSTNKNAYVSETLREKLKNIQEFEL